MQGAGGCDGLLVVGSSLVLCSDFTLKSLEMFESLALNI